VPAKYVVERSASISDFYDVARTYLLAHEAEHGLMISVASSTLAKPADAYWGVVRNQSNDVVAAALRTIPKMMLSREGEQGAMAAIADDARQANFQSVIGPRSSMEAFAAAFGGNWRPTRNHLLYECRFVRHTPAANGTPRTMAIADRGLVADWIQAFSAEAIGDGATREAAEALTDRHIRDRSMWLWCIGGEPVACAAAVGRTPHGIRITSVYTAPTQRRNGYGSSLVASLTRDLLQRGREFVFLYADGANPTATAMYERIGYQQIAEVGELDRRAENA